MLDFAPTARTRHGKGPRGKRELRRKRIALQQQHATGRMTPAKAESVDALTRSVRRVIERRPST